MFEGSLVAVVTPFTADGSIDRDAFVGLLEWQIEQGTHGLVINGTTGENPTLSAQERRLIWSLAVDCAAGRVPVICGAGTNNTAETVTLCKEAGDAGADAALVVCPYYNKPTQAGLIAHFKAAAAAGPPIVLYNVPGRTAGGLSLDAIETLAQHPNIVALKEATGDVAFATDISRISGDGLTLLSGDDPSALAFWAVGGRGSISVTANVAPALCAEMWTRFDQGDLDGALAIQHRLMPLHRSLFVESNPIPVKAALEILGRCGGAPRLPMIEANTETRRKLTALLTELGLR